MLLNGGSELNATTRGLPRRDQARDLLKHPGQIFLRLLLTGVSLDHAQNVSRAME